MHLSSRPEEPDLVKGLVAGLAGGLLASFLMEQFQALWSKAAREIQPAPPRKKSGKTEEPATVKAADAIAHAVDETIPSRHKAAAGEAVHYAMGAASGALYGVASEATTLTTAGDGLLFGAAVWMAADNMVVPALGLAKPPTKTPLGTHVYALASHLVYGFVTEVVRRAMRRAL